MKQILTTRQKMNYGHGDQTFDVLEMSVGSSRARPARSECLTGFQPKQILTGRQDLHVRRQHADLGAFTNGVLG